MSIFSKLLHKSGKPQPFFLKENLSDSLQGLSKIIMNSKPSCLKSLANTIAIVKKESIVYGATETGGIIVFSRSVHISSNEMVQRMKNYYYHSFNDSESMENIEGLTIGKYFVGFYFDFTYREYFSESCLCLEILGGSSSSLEYHAERLAKDFQQHSVLIKEYADGKIYLFNERRKR